MRDQKKAGTFVELTDLPAAGQPTNSSYNAELDEKLSFVQSVRRWPRMTLYALALTAPIVLSGYDISIISSVASLPQFQYDTAAPHKVVSNK